MAREQELEFRTDYSELKLTGVLNYDIYQKMSKDDLTKFIKRDAEGLARKFVSMGWEDAVNIRSEYVVVDNYFTIKETVTAQMVYTHTTGVVCGFDFNVNSKLPNSIKTI